MPQQKIFRILSLGDSYTIGEGVAPRDRFPEQLVAELRQAGCTSADPQIVAHTGWTTGELLAASDLAGPILGAARPWDFVTLMAGVNNQYRGLSIQEYRAEFTDLLNLALDWAGGAARHVVVLSIPDWGVSPFASGRDRKQIAAEIDAFNAVNHTLAVFAGVHYLNVTFMSRQSGGGDMFAPDGLHPSCQVYEAWAHQLFSLAWAIYKEQNAEDQS